MKYFSLLATCILLLSAGCFSNTEEELNLSEEVLAWQPYRTGQELRFGRAGSSKVRTFLITDVKRSYVRLSLGGTAPVYLGPPKKVRTENLDVYARRTDTLRYARTPTSTPTRPDSVPFTQPVTLLSMGVGPEGNDSSTYLEWDIGFSCALPLDQVVRGYTLYDTTTQLLPTVRLGGLDYSSVLRISDGQRQLQDYFPRVRPARLVYYAKGYGVVGFVEEGVLWYRLP